MAGVHHGPPLDAGADTAEARTVQRFRGLGRSRPLHLAVLGLAAGAALVAGSPTVWFGPLAPSVVSADGPAALLLMASAGALAMVGRARLATLGRSTTPADVPVLGLLAEAGIRLLAASGAYLGEGALTLLYLGPIAWFMVIGGIAWLAVIEASSGRG